MARRGAVVLLLACSWACLRLGSGHDPSTSAPGTGDDSAARSRLYNDLLFAYHNVVPPKMPVVTSYRLTIVQIDGVDEKDNLLRISVWASTNWKDNRFVWDPDSFGGIRSLTIDSDKVWLPDLRPHAHVLDAENVMVTVHNDGTMYRWQPLKLAVYCSFDLARYPFDTQHCNLRVESWSHHADQINLTHYGGGVDTSHLMEHSLWELTNTTTTRNLDVYACCVEQYVSLSFVFTLRRRTAGYTVRVVAPSVLTSLLVLVCFLVPPSRGERPVLAAVLLLCLLLQLLHLNLTVPLTDTGSPYLARFVCFGAFLAFFACVESVVALNLVRGFWSDESAGRPEAGGEFPGAAQTKTNTPVARIARIVDVIFFFIFTFIFAVVGGVLLNP